MTLSNDFATPTSAERTETDKLAGKSDLESCDARTLAQRRLALKFVSNAGLSMPLAEVLVAAALGDGRA